MLNFSVIGDRAAQARKSLKVETPGDLVTLSRDSIVEIEIEQGMAYTKEGQKATMQEVMNTMIELLKTQAIPPQAIQTVAQKYLETLQFGSTEEFMTDIDEAFKNGPNLTQQQLTMVKTAVLQALKEAEEIGPAADKTKVMAAKVGTLEALHQSGLAKTIQGTGQVAPQTKPGDINYKDAPEDVKRQMEQAAGFSPSKMVSPVATDQVLKHAKAMTEMQKQQQATLQAQQPQGGPNV